MILKLPYPPSTNNLYRSSKNGKRYKTAEALAYHNEAGMLARVVFAEPLQGKLSVSIVVYPKIGIGIDVDNAAKATLDALTGVCWKDDSQVWRLTVERAEKRTGGALAVCIEPYEETT